MKDDIRSGFPCLVVSVSRLVFLNFSVFSVGVWRVFLFLGGEVEFKHSVSL